MLYMFRPFRAQDQKKETCQRVFIFKVTLTRLYLFYVDKVCCP